MRTVDDVLRIAAAEIGTVEGPHANEVKYNRWYYGYNAYGSAYAWCDVFVSWVFEQAGALDLIHGKCAYTPAHVSRFKKAGAWHVGTKDIAPGDVVFFDFPDSVYRVQHVGIVEKVGKYGLLTIEGNTKLGNDSDGGHVMRRERTFGTYIVGYGRPAYEKAVVTSSPGGRELEARDVLVHDAVGRTVAMTDAICKKLGINPTVEPNTGTTNPLQAILEMVARIESNTFAIKQQVGA